MIRLKFFFYRVYWNQVKVLLRGVFGRVWLRDRLEASLRWG
jgi:hypothetical protein